MNTVRTFVLALAAFAQRHGGGGFHGGGGYQGGYRNTPHRGGGFQGGGFGRPRSSFPGGSYHGGQGGYRSGAGSSRGYWNGHLPSHHVYRPAGPVRITNRYNAHVTNNVHIAVRPYRPVEWRRYHPNWHERYYYHGGHYFYDSAYSYPAVIDNEWGSIAALSGGVALLGAFNNDPYLFFAGTAGALYSFSRYDQDRYHGDRYGRLRAAYFARPYFWRSGVRYDRVVVSDGGTRYYRFRRR